MKRQVLAVLVGSLFALPALANNEIDAGHQFSFAAGKSRAQVNAELVSAKQSGSWMVNAELGTQNKSAGPVQYAGKSREQVRAEVAQALPIVNAELGTTSNTL